jgi:hypothetical protein
MPPRGPRREPGTRLLFWFLVGGGALLLALAALLPRAKPNRTSPSAKSAAADRVAGPAHAPGFRGAFAPNHPPASAPQLVAADIVAGKLKQFARGRRQILHGLAARFNVAVPSEMEKFFDAVETGNWEEIKAQFEALKKLRQEGGLSEDTIRHLWPAVLDTFGAAEQAHLWPAQKLLDYGNAVLDSLRPGMVYVGGTDFGRWIPELLNETSDGERHIILTQNALADASYLDYLSYLYGDRLATLTGADSQQAFEDYLADARRRLEHDQQHPDEPRQIRPGEDINLTDGRVQVSGQVAVMAINELLVQKLMQKNPDLSFAMEESFPFSSLYANAAPLGPLIELRAQDSAAPLTAESAAQTLDYWGTRTQQVLADPEASGSSEVLRSYAHDIAAQANLFASNHLTDQADQAYQLAIQLTPADPGVVFRYVKLLLDQKRFADARQIAATAASLAPDNQQFQNLLQQVNKLR